MRQQARPVGRGLMELHSTVATQLVSYCLFTGELKGSQNRQILFLHQSCEARGRKNQSMAKTSPIHVPVSGEGACAVPLQCLSFSSNATAALREGPTTRERPAMGRKQGTEVSDMEGRQIVRVMLWLDRESPRVFVPSVCILRWQNVINNHFPFPNFRPHTHTTSTRSTNKHSHWESRTNTQSGTARQRGYTHTSTAG